MAPPLDQLGADHGRSKTSLKQMTASDVKVFEVGDFTFIAHGLGAKYGKNAPKVTNSDSMLTSSAQRGGQEFAIDAVEDSPQEAAELSFLSDDAEPKCLDSSMIRSTSQITTPASSIDELRMGPRRASPVTIAPKPPLDITYHHGDDVEFHCTTALASQAKSEDTKKQGEAKGKPVTPKKSGAAKKVEFKLPRKDKRSYASVLQEGNMRQQMQYAAEVPGPLQCPPDLIYASYGASKRYEERKTTAKLRLCDESLAALEAKGRFNSADEASRVHQVFEEPTEIGIRVNHNILSSGLLPDNKGARKDASGVRDVEAVLATQWNNKSRRIHAVHRAVTQAVDKELAPKAAAPKNKIHESRTKQRPNPGTAVISGKIAIGVHKPNEPVEQMNKPRDQVLTGGRPQSMRASDGGSCIQCMDIHELPRSTDAHSVINPLEDIKKWSVKYFQKRDPAIAKQMAAHGSKKQPELSPDRSETDTRNLDEVRSALVPREYNDPQMVTEWMIFTGQYGPRLHYDPRANVAIRAQLSSWDGDLKPPSKAQLENACWSLGHFSAMSVDRWIDFNVDIKHRYFMDEQSPGFKSGASRPSGLLKNCLVHPPDLLCEHLEPDFSSIDWTKNVTYPPHNRDRLSPFQSLQSSELCRQITLAPYMEKVAEVEMLRDEAQKKMNCANEDVNANRQENAWVPRANFYVRPARRIDIPQLVELYNEWIRNSVFTKRETNLQDEDFVEDFEHRKKTGLPFLVAATKSSHRGQGTQQMGTSPHAHQSRGRRNRRLSIQAAREEKIIGIVFAEAYKETKNIFRGIIEVKLFVSPACVRLGVGKTLLDRIMTYVDPMYDSKRGTYFEFSEREDNVAYKLGPPNKIRKVLIDVLYSSDQAQDFTWKKEMLETKFGFHQAGFYLNFAERDEKPINMASFVRESFNAPGNQSMMYPGQLKEIEGIFSPNAVRRDAN